MTRSRHAMLRAADMQAMPFVREPPHSTKPLLSDSLLTHDGMPKHHTPAVGAALAVLQRVSTALLSSDMQHAQPLKEV